MEPNVRELILKATLIEVPVRAKRGLATLYVEISKADAEQIIVWHDLQHMTAGDANRYIGFVHTAGYIRMGEIPA